MRCADRSRRAAAGIRLLGLLPLLGALLAFGAQAACPAVPPQPLGLPATTAALSRGEPIVIVAFGSSSTAGAGASSRDRTYPAQLRALLRRTWPSASVTVLNRGVGGQTTQEMLARVGPDVLDAVPTLVIWQNGGHAALREMDVAEFEALTRSGVREFQVRGIDVILMDNQLAPRIVSRPGHALYDAVLARVATETGVSLFSRAALMRDWAAAEPDGQPMIGEDNLHHTDRGYACVAAALAAAIEAAVPAAMVHEAARPPVAPAR